jgi:SAM-dependent methyltransferase
LKSFESQRPLSVSSYDEVADEYYDRKRHPTCSNFNYLSRLYIGSKLSGLDAASTVVEVGAGDSSVAPLIQTQGRSLTNLVITDASLGMLRHSRKWEPFGATVHICDATSMHSADASIALVVAGLGDPYNTPEFWKEIHRILMPGGQVIFTVPSFEWAVRFRGTVNPVSACGAEFELRDGRTVLVPSFVYPLERQIEMIENAGNIVINFEALDANALGIEPRSPKIDVFSGQLLSLIWGFVACKVSDHIPTKIREQWRRSDL